MTFDDEGLRALLLHTLAHYPWLKHLTSSMTITFFSNFEPIVHNWSLLNDIANNDSSKPIVSEFHNELASASEGLLLSLKPPGSLEKATTDLRLLLDEVRRTPGLESYFNSAREMQQNNNTVSYEHLWTIFPPGELVFSSAFMDRPQAFIVKNCADSYFKRKGSSDERWILECWTYDWNGTHFSRTPVEFSFENFKGTKSIISLPCYPLKFHRDSKDEANSSDGIGLGEPMKQKLIRRGERYRELCLKKKGAQIFDYEGELLTRGTGVRRVITRHQVSHQ